MRFYNITHVKVLPPPSGICPSEPETSCDLIKRKKKQASWERTGFGAGFKTSVIPACFLTGSVRYELIVQINSPLTQLGARGPSVVWRGRMIGTKRAWLPVCESRTFQLRERGVPVVLSSFYPVPAHLERQANGSNVKQGREAVKYLDSQVKEMIGYSWWACGTPV